MGTCGMTHTHFICFRCDVLHGAILRPRFEECLQDNIDREFDSQQFDKNPVGDKEQSGVEV